MLGRGGTGEVYRAATSCSGARWRSSRCRRRWPPTRWCVARLDREARLLAALNHPNIATLYSLEGGDADGFGARPFLVLELVPGEDLASRLQRGPLPVEEALRVGGQVAARARGGARRGIVHRDLKPANVVDRRRRRRVKVLDFGVAKVLGEVARGGGRGDRRPGGRCRDAGREVRRDSSHAGRESQKLTPAGTLTGTIPYMSPEQLRGEEVDARTDLWAFGCLLFECLTGVRAFGKPKLVDTFAAILGGEPRWELLPAGTPPAVRVLLERCLHKVAAERLQQVESLRLALEHALGAGARPLAAQPSVAVLPFVSPGSDPEPQYFGDGLAEEVINLAAPGCPACASPRAAPPSASAARARPTCARSAPPCASARCSRAASAAPTAGCASPSG